MGWVPGRPVLAGFKVVAMVGAVVPGEVGPTKVASGSGLIDLIKSSGSSLVVGPTGVGSDFSPVEISGGPINTDAEGVAVAHDVDFRACLGCSGRKEISSRDGNGAVGFRVDPQDFSSEIIGVGG